MRQIYNQGQMILTLKRITHGFLELIGTVLICIIIHSIKFSKVFKKILYLGVQKTIVSGARIKQKPSLSLSFHK